jgi:tRNA1Val (adenine37-N6)-methyltransferase
MHHSGMKVTTDSFLLSTLSHHPNPKHILDIGAGNGILSLTLAQRFPQARIHAVEVNPEAYKDLEYNILHSPFRHQIVPHAGDIVALSSSFIRDQLFFDLVVSNPPFFEHQQTSPFPEKNTYRHAEVFQLSAERLVSVAFSLLTPQGLFYVMYPYDRLEECLFHVHQKKGHLISCRTCSHSPSHRHHIFIASYGKEPPTESVIARPFYLKETDGRYSAEAVSLLSPFYLPGVLERTS